MLMLDREAWRSGISMIVKENISSNSGRCRTRGDIELRDILSRLVVVDVTSSVVVACGYVLMREQASNKSEEH
jgi:hypothetical protein